MQFIHLMKYRYKGTLKKKNPHSPGGGLKRMIVFILSAQRMSVACPQYLKHMDHETFFMFPWCVCVPHWGNRRAIRLSMQEGLLMEST